MATRVNHQEAESIADCSEMDQLRRENEQLKRTVNIVAGGAAQGMMLHSKITNAFLAGKRKSEERVQRAVGKLKSTKRYLDPTVIDDLVDEAIALLDPEGK